MSTPDFNRRDLRPSEFGGRPGLIQRASDGHDYMDDASEQLYLFKRTDPLDADTDPGVPTDLIS